MRRLVTLALAAVVVVAMAAALVGVVRLARDDDGRPGSGRGLGMMGAGGSMMGGRGRLDEAAYLTEMVAHHEEAVVAAHELARSDRPQLRALGTAIVETQTAQVERMRTWLAAWYPDEPPAQDYRPMMDDLSGLSGDRLDRTFLREMVVHHMAAVMMSQHLLLRGVEHDEVAELARAIRDGQHAEIVVMRRWLARWSGVRPGVRPLH